jgi:hypothetical protein
MPYRARARHRVFSGATVALYTYNEYAEAGHTKKESDALKSHPL